MSIAFKASIDTSLTQTLNNWGVSHHTITSIAAKDFVYITILLGVIWIALNSLKEVKPFAVGGYIKHVAIDGFFILALPVGLTTVVSELISKWHVRQRPFVSMHNVHAVIQHAADGGFPSHHAAFMAAIATGVYLRNRQAGNGLMWLTVICGIARVAAGIHYPTDVIFGITLGVVITVATNRVLMRLLRM
jgi:membrane-associated phospholipid phosphatase